MANEVAPVSSFPFDGVECGSEGCHCRTHGRWGVLGAASSWLSGDKPWMSVSE